MFTVMLYIMREMFVFCFININWQHGGRSFFPFQSFRCNTKNYCAVETGCMRYSVWAGRGHTYVHILCVKNFCKTADANMATLRNWEFKSD
jgi:hypothetical protein